MNRESCKETERGREREIQRKGNQRRTEYIVMQEQGNNKLCCHGNNQFVQSKLSH